MPTLPFYLPPNLTQDPGDDRPGKKIPLPPVPRIAPLTPPPTPPPPPDVLSQWGGQVGSLLGGGAPISVGPAATRPPITVQPPAPPAPDKRTLATSAGPLTDLGPVTSAFPATPAPTQAPAAPPASTRQAEMDQWNAEVAKALQTPVQLAGTTLTTRSPFGGGYKEETRSLDPLDLARQLAGTYGNYKDFLEPGAALSQNMMGQAQAQLAEQNRMLDLSRRFGLEQQTQLGRLQMEQQRHLAELAGQMMPLTAEGRKQLLMNKLLAEGKTPQEVNALVASAETLGQFGAAPPTAAPGAAPAAAAGAAPAPAGTAPQAAVDPRNALARLDPTLLAELDQIKDPTQAWQHVFDRKGGDWISQNRDAVMNYFNTIYGKDTMRDLQRTGVGSGLLTGIPDLLTGIDPFSSRSLWTPQGRAAYSQQQQIPFGERFNRLFGINQAGSNASALLRALTGQ